MNASSDDDVGIGECAIAFVGDRDRPSGPFADCAHRQGTSPGFEPIADKELAGPNWNIRVGFETRAVLQDAGATAFGCCAVIAAVFAAERCEGLFAGNWILRVYGRVD